MKKLFPLLAMIFFAGSAVIGQSTPAAYPDPSDSMATELTRISRSVTSLSQSMKTFVEKFEKVGGLSFSEKQHRLIIGLELLVRAEQRVAILQKFQIELVEKLNETRGKLSQVEVDLRPRNIDRSVIFEGTTETEELRESKRLKLQGERSNLSQLSQQIQGNLAETNENLREAQLLAARLRKLYIPQVEREMQEQ